MPLSLAVALRRFGVPARPLYTVASLLVLVYWLAPSSWTDWMSGNLDGGMEMFFVSGIMMVASATIAIIWNAELLTGFVSFLGRAFSRWLPAVKTAVAYPSASKGRTGMTIAMFSLIIFSLVMMATINANFVADLHHRPGGSRVGHPGARRRRTTQSTTSNRRCSRMASTPARSPQ